MITCILPELVERIKNLDLETMTYEKRVKAFTDLLGEQQGRDILNIYEKSKLLANQKTAFEKFINNIDGVSVKAKEELKKKLAERLSKKQQIIKDEELLSLVKETLDKKYDLDIPDEVLFQITKIRNEITPLEKAAKGTPDGSPEKLAWGKKIVEVSDIIAKQKELAGGYFEEVKLGGKRIAGRIKDKEYLRAVGQIIEELGTVVFSPATKSIKASLDNSVLLRQGLKVLSADKGIWGKNAVKTWQMWGKVLNKESMDEMSKAFKADLVTRDLYQAAIKSKLAIGVIEDFFPTSVTQNIPVLGRFFKASDEAFTMFSQGSRMDLFEKYVKIFQEANAGAMPSAEIMKDFAKIANSVTGRGGLGKLEASSGLLNQILFSARYQTAQLNTIRHAFTMSGPAGEIAKKQMFRHLLMIGTIMTIASQFGDVGWNPKESTFGKVRLPGTKKWVDVTGGIGSYFSVIGKMLDKYQNPTYKETALNIFIDFMKGKLAPAPGVARDILEQRDYSGKKPTPLSITRSLFMPITLDNPIKDYEKDVDASTTALSTFLEFGGLSVTNPKGKSEGSYWKPTDLLK